MHMYKLFRSFTCTHQNYCQFSSLPTVYIQFNITISITFFNVHVSQITGKNDNTLDLKNLNVEGGNTFRKLFSPHDSNKLQKLFILCKTKHYLNTFKIHGPREIGKENIETLIQLILIEIYSQLVWLYMQFLKLLIFMCCYLTFISLYSI